MSGPIEITPGALGIAALLLLVNAGLSLWLRLALERQLLVASLRTVIQLTLLGYILVPVFKLASPGLILGVGFVMLALAAREALKRAGKRYPGAQLNTFVALLLASTLTLAVATQVVLSVDPWWEPRYLIPLLGMILGNALTGVSLGLDRCLSELQEGKSRVEALLAYGATAWEAARPVAVLAIRAGLIPILNSMSVVGLVTIPGMMTGQLLGGTSPALAARYQILIMFLIAAATALGAGLAILLSLRSCFDKQGRLRDERIRVQK